MKTPSFAYQTLISMPLRLEGDANSDPTALAWAQLAQALQQRSLVIDPLESHDLSKTRGRIFHQAPSGSANALHAMLLGRPMPYHQHNSLMTGTASVGWEHAADAALALAEQGACLFAPDMPASAWASATALGAFKLLEKTFRDFPQVIRTLDDMRFTLAQCQGMPLIHIAAASGSAETLDLLLSLGLDGQAHNSAGEGVAFYARTPSTLAVLKKHEAILNVRDPNGEGKTPEQMIEKMPLTAAARTQLKNAWAKHFPLVRTTEDVLRELFPRVLTITKTELDREFRAHKLTGKEEVNGQTLLEAAGRRALANPSSNTTPQALLSLWNRGEPERMGKSGYTDGQLLYLAKRNSSSSYYGNKIYELLPFDQSPSCQRLNELSGEQELQILTQVATALGEPDMMSAASSSYLRLLRQHEKSGFTQATAAHLMKFAAAEYMGRPLVDYKSSNSELWTELFRQAAASSTLARALVESGTPLMMDSLLTHMLQNRSREKIVLEEWFGSPCPPEAIEKATRPEPGSRLGYGSTKRFGAGFVLSCWWGSGLRPSQPKKWINPVMDSKQNPEFLPVAERLSALLSEEALEQTVSLAGGARRARM